MNHPNQTGLAGAAVQPDGLIPLPDGRFPTCEPAPDVLVQDFGAVTILWPRTAQPKAWFAERAESRETWGSGTVCEPRNVEPIVAGLLMAGFDMTRSA